MNLQCTVLTSCASSSLELCTLTRNLLFGLWVGDPSLITTDSKLGQLEVEVGGFEARAEIADVHMQVVRMGLPEGDLKIVAILEAETQI